jgi:hypothetical protein
MVPGFMSPISISTVVPISATHYPPAKQSRAQGAAPADTWAKDAGQGSHQEPAGNRVNCWSETYCYGVVRMCHTWCDNGEDSRTPCGGCVGVGGISLDLW